MKKLFKAISKWFFKVSYETPEHKKFRAYITNFYDNYDPNLHYNMYKITKCRVYNFPKQIVIEIHSISPGMIVGPRDECIERLKSFLGSKYKKPISIDLQETNPFK